MRLLRDLDRFSEDLAIKINYTSPKMKPEAEIAVLGRFGIVQSIITNTLEFLFSQKIRATLKRKDFQPRDLYDIVWFLSHKVKPSLLLFSELKVKNEKELFKELDRFYQKSKTKS